MGWTITPDAVKPMRDLNPGLFAYYRTSLEAGFRSLLGPHRREAMARIVNPLSYPRWMEYDLAVNGLGHIDGCRVLDIGSPKLPALVLARNTNCELYATDIRDYFIPSTSQFLTNLGLGHRLGRNIHLEVQDARELTYPDASFDRVFSISVLEHIPDHGDSEAMREIARVLRPGGILTLTVPFKASGYREDWVRGKVYERAGDASGSTFYQRHYDEDTLNTRLIAPSELAGEQIVYFGEPGLQFEPYWNRVPMKWKLPLLWAQPFIARAFLRKLPVDRVSSACGVALKLRKH
jgi:SAM-dependent methyltransferase